MIWVIRYIVESSHRLYGSTIQRFNDLSIQLGEANEIGL